MTHRAATTAAEHQHRHRPDRCEAILPGRHAAWYKEQAKLQNPVLQRMLLEGKMQIRADDNRQWVVRQQETLHSIHDLITSLVNIGALQEIYDTIREYCDMILEIQLGFWRNQYAKSFHELGSVQLAVALLSSSGLGVPLSYSQGVQGVVAGSYVGSGTNLPAQPGVLAGSGQVNGRVPHAQGPGGTDADGDREASRRTNGAGEPGLARREKTIRQSVLLAHNMTRLLTALRNGMIQDWETFVLRLNELVPEEMWVDTDFTNRMLAEWGGTSWTPDIQGAGDLLDTDVEAAYPDSADVAMLDPENDPDLTEGDGPSDEEMALARDDSHASDAEGEDE
jgi:hypothetical protein